MCSYVTTHGYIFVCVLLSFALQACILMLFNDNDKLTYHEISTATDIPVLDLKRSLQSLACVKGRNVLKKEPMSKVGARAG